MTKMLVKHALITVVVIAGISYLSRESEPVRQVTQSKSGTSWFGRSIDWIADHVPHIWPFY